MSKQNKCNIIYSYKKSNKNVLFGNLSPKMSDPAFQINNTLKQYVDRKLNENLIDIDKQLFKAKNNIKKIKSTHGITKRNNRQNNYTTINSISKDNLQIFSSLQNLSISIINNNNKNINIDDENLLFKNISNKKKDNAKRIFSYTKINERKITTNNKESKNKSSHRIKFHLSGKMPNIKEKNIFKKCIHSSSTKNIKINNCDNNINKTNIREKDYYNTVFRLNSSNMKNNEFNNNNLYSDRYISNKDNFENNNNLSLTQRFNFNSFNSQKKLKNKISGSLKNKQKYMKNNIQNKYNNKNCSKFQPKKNNKILISKKESKSKIINKKKIDINQLNNIKTDNINNNFEDNKNINGEANNYYIQSSDKTESNNNSSILNLHLNEKKNIDGYELCWNLKNDYSKDFDISLVSINNQKKSIIKNYKVNKNNYNNNFNDNNNINNIYLNNIQNVNNINNKDNTISNINNKPEYYTKLELLENENLILKNEIKESKNRISALEYKIEELLDDKNSKENSECPQPTPYVIKYSKDFIPIKIKPKFEENSQDQIVKTSQEIIREYSKNETKESDISNRIQKF